MTNREGEGWEGGFAVGKGNHYAEVLLGAGLCAKQRYTCSGMSRIISVPGLCAMSCDCPMMACKDKVPVQCTGRRYLVPK